MPDPIAWEYLVETLGSWIRSPKDPELASRLNELGEDGWECVSALPREGSQVCDDGLATPARPRRAASSKPPGRAVVA